MLLLLESQFLNAVQEVWKWFGTSKNSVSIKKSALVRLAGGPGCSRRIAWCMGWSERGWFHDVFYGVFIRLSDWKSRSSVATAATWLMVGPNLAGIVNLYEIDGLIRFDWKPAFGGVAFLSSEESINQPDAWNWNSGQLPGAKALPLKNQLWILFNPHESFVVFLPQ